MKVKEWSPEGLLKPLVWVNLIGLSEAEAKQKLIEGVQTDRAKPLHLPLFPGERSVQEKPTYPQGRYTMGTIFPLSKEKKRISKLAISLKKRFRQSMSISQTPHRS